VLQAVLEKYDIPKESFAPVCVIVDKVLPTFTYQQWCIELPAIHLALDFGHRLDIGKFNPQFNLNESILMSFDYEIFRVVWNNIVDA